MEAGTGMGGIEAGCGLWIMVAWVREEHRAGLRRLTGND